MKKKKKKISQDLRGGTARKVAIFTIVVVAFMALALARGWLLGMVGKLLVKEDPLERAEVAVVLSGAYWDRAREAADIYREGHVRRILLMRELKPVGYEDMLEMGIKVPLKHEVNQKILSYYKVPSSAIVLMDEEANSTSHEAEILQRYVQAKGVSSMIVITSPYHSRRACLIISSRLKGRTKVICHPSKYDDFYPRAWWRQRRQARNVFLEYTKLLFYLPSILWHWLF